MAISTISLISLFTGYKLYIMIAIAALAALVTVFVAISCFRVHGAHTRRKKTSTGYEITDFEASTMPSTATMTNTSTATAYQQAIFLPAYLEVKYGIQFRPREMLAQGGFGTIMIGDALSMDQVPAGTRVIIKELISTDKLASEKAIESFDQEVAIMTFLVSYKNIATIYGYSTKPYTIVMKYYPKGSLHNWIHSRPRKTKLHVLGFAKVICRGVFALHDNGLVHADIKPHNVLLDWDAETNQLFCVLTDFGITQVFNTKSLLVKAFKPVEIKGASLAYASPEAILRLRRKRDIPSEQLPLLDIFSVAIVLFELVCGGVYGRKLKQ